MAVNTGASQHPLEKLKSEVLATRGYWHAFHEGLLALSPSYLQAYLDFHNPPFLAGHLDRKMCEFIYIAADAAVSHLFTPGVEMHIEAALRLGATALEIMEVIQLATLAAHSSHTVGMPILVEEMARAGVTSPAATRELTEEEHAAKADFIDTVGHWPEGGDAIFRFAPRFARGFLAYAQIPFREGPLSKKDKELILIGVFASPVAPQPDTLRTHIRLALQHGASPEEIADVLQLTSAIAIHTCVAAIPALTAATTTQKVSSATVKPNTPNPGPDVHGPTTA